jgi:hypothetical protein
VALYFQFADRAVAALPYLQALFQEGIRDMRYMRIYMDISTEAGAQCGMVV